VLLDGVELCAAPEFWPIADEAVSAVLSTAEDAVSDALFAAEVAVSDAVLAAVVAAPVAAPAIPAPAAAAPVAALSLLPVEDVFAALPELSHVAAISVALCRLISLPETVPLIDTVWFSLPCSWLRSLPLTLNCCPLALRL